MNPKKQGKKFSKSIPLKKTNFVFRNYPYILIIIVGLLVYLKTISYSYSPLDDTLLIKNRMEWLLDKSNFNEVFTRGIFTREGSMAPDYYRPILTLSFKIDAILSNGKISFFHFSNIFYHIIASLLCFLVLKKFSISEKKAFIYTLLFTIHPAFVHAVAWIPGRNDTLLAIFVFASLFFYIDFVKEKKNIHYFFSLIFFLLALFTKENVIFLPILLFFSDHLITNKTRYKQILIATPGFIIIITFWWIVRSSIVSTADVVYALNPFQAIVKSIEPLILYIGKTALPINQSVLPNVSDSSVIPGLFILCLFLFLSVRYRFNNPKMVVFGASWFLIFLIIPLLYSTITGEGLQYEHRLYLSLFGILLVISQLKIATLKFPIILSIIIMFSGKTFVRCQVYKDTLSFAKAAVVESPSLAMSHNMMGIEYNNLHDYKNAINEYTQALEIEPTKYTSMFNRASTFYNMKEYDLALKDYNFGLLNDSLNAKAFFDRGNVYFDMANFDAAIIDYTKAIKIYPEYSNAHNNRGNAYSNLREYQKAIDDYSKAIKYRQTNVNALNNRANAYSAIHEYSKALNDIDMALIIKPYDNDFIQNRNVILAEIRKLKNEESFNVEMKLSSKEQQLLPKAYQFYKSKNYSMAKDIFYELYQVARGSNQLRNAASHYNNVGLCYIKMGNHKEAEKILQSIKAFYPNYEKTYLNLGLLYRTTKNTRLAINFYNKALEINPDNKNAKINLEQLKALNNF